MIYRRPDSRYYWYDFLFEGKRCQGSTKMTNRKAADRVEAVLKTRLAEGRVGIVERRPVPRLSDYEEHFLQVIGLDRKPRTVAFYRTCLGNLRPEFGAKRLGEIMPEGIRAYKERRLLSGCAGRTINCDLATLRRVFSIAVKEGVLASSPFAGRRVEFSPEHRPERVISYVEEEKYLAVANPLLRDVAVLMLEMGLRPSEVFRIHSRDVRLSDSPPCLYVPDSKTPAGRRELPVPSKALKVLAARLDRAKGGYLFPARIRDGGLDSTEPMQDVHKAHERALRASKISPRFRLYDLRHTFGTRAAEAGTDSLTLARLMGHKDLKTTARYVHLSKRHLAEAQKQIETFRRKRESVELRGVRRAELQAASRPQLVQ
jgi:integrase